MFEEIEKAVTWQDATARGQEATFVPNKRLPIYNWFYYKEGFSRDLVWSLLDSWQPSGPVFDPFCGSGTTLLACKQKGIPAVGIDVLPIAAFAAKVKTADYDPIELRDAAKQVLKAKFRKIIYEYPPPLKRAFSRYALEDISVFREAIMRMEHKKFRDFFLLALIDAAMKCSYAWKDGGAIKIKKRPVPPLRVMLNRVIRSMIRDVVHAPGVTADIKVALGDARRVRLEDESVAAVITSPPYLNNIDYTKIYEIEQFILHEKEQPGIRSYLGAEKEVENKALPEFDLPPMAAAYFNDMDAVLEEFARVMQPGARAALVIGNAYFSEPRLIVPSDALLAHMARRHGLRCEHITIMNIRKALEQRTRHMGDLRESLVQLQKEP